MILFRLSAASAREAGDPSHPHVRLSARDTWSEQDLDQVTHHLRADGCVHVTLTVPRDRLLPAGRQRRGGRAESAVRDRLADLAGLVGSDASRVMVRVAWEPSAPATWWGRWAWRRGIGGPGCPSVPACPLDEFLAPTEPSPGEVGPCTGRPHVLAVATSPLSWEVIDELHRWVSTGQEAHLVLTVPRSPVSRDPHLHVMWERRMALDVADRRREIAQLWPDTALVRTEVVRTDVPAARGGRARRLVRRAS